MTGPKLNISKKNIRTMEKDLALAQGKVSVGQEEEKENSKSSLEAEEIRRQAEEKRLQQLEEEGKRMAEEIKQKAEQEKQKAKQAEFLKREQLKRQAEEEELKRLEELKRAEEAEKTAALQEERRKAEELAHQQEARAEEAEKMRQKQQALKREAALAEQKRIEAEEKKKREEEEKERRREDQKTEKERLEKERLQISKEKLAVEQELAKIREEKSLLDQDRNEISGKISSAEAKFQQIESEEKEIEKQEALIEEKESASASAEERKKFEKERWIAEDKRQELERARWPWDEKLQEAERQLSELEKKSAGFLSAEKDLLKKESEIRSKEEENGRKLERIKLKEELKKAEAALALLEEKVNSLFGSYSSSKSALEKILAEENQIEKEKRLIEQNEKTASSLEERRVLEKERWTKDEKRRQIESKRWQAEEDKNKKSKELNLQQNKLKAVLAKKDTIAKRLQELDGQPQKPLSPKPVPDSAPAAVAEKPPRKKEPSVPERRPLIRVIEKSEPSFSKDQPALDRLQAAKARIEALKKKEVPASPESPQTEEQNVPLGEKADFAEEAESLEIKKFMENERRRENAESRIRTVLKESPQPAENAKIPAQTKKGLEEIIRIVPKKPSWKEKFLARFLIVLGIGVISAGVVTFWYWFFVVRVKPPEIPAVEEVKVPPALFEVGDTLLFNIAGNSEIKELALGAVSEWQPDNFFKRIVFKKENSILGLKEILSALAANIPFEFFNSIDDRPTFFVYSQPQGNRLGFAVKIKDRDLLAKTMADSEASLEDGLKGLFQLMAQGEILSGAPAFRNASEVEGYKGKDFRFKPLNSKDLGICYFIADYYLAFASSWKSMEELLARLDYSLQRRMLVQDLKFGDEGVQVELLQKWLSRDLDVYPEKVISGSFADVTQKAVVRFQEKYYKEILEPQALEKGTGIVDLATREKLNSLYSDF